MRALRVAGAALLTGLVLPVSLVVGTAVPASAGSSASGILNNAWIITELGGSVMSDDAQWATLSPGEKTMATTATGTAVATTGLSTTPKAGGKLGMVLNTVATLGGLAFVFGGGDDEPGLPSAGEGTQFTGSGCGGAVWWAGSTAVASCTASNVTMSYTGTNGRWFRSVSGGPYVNTNSLTTNITVGWATDLAGHTSIIYEAFTGGNSTYGTGTRVAVWKINHLGNAPMGNPTETADPATTPRYIDSTINCRTPGGGLAPYTQTTGPFTITPGSPWTTPEVPDMTCPAGTVLESGGRVIRTPGAPAGSDVALQEPYVAPPWVMDQVIAFPDCYPATTTMCVLRVERKVPLPVVDCHAFAAGTGNPCADWWSDPQRSTRYDCSFGGQVVPLKRCKPYADTFSIGVIGESDPDPDGELTDPVPGTDPTPEATPGLGGCVPNWGLELLNPWWVFKATSCALVWAFVPTALPPFGEIPSPLPPGWMPSLPSWEAGSCGPLVMPAFTLGPLVGQVGPTELFNSCDQPWPIARNVTYYGLLGLLTIRIAGRAFRAVMQALGMAVDYTQGGDDK